MAATAEAVEIRPQPGPQESFLASPADIVIYGGAAGGGKTWGLLLEPVRHVNNADFGAVIFRRTSPQIRNEGGLWDESQRLYPLLGAEPKETVLEWDFPSGARVKFAHMQYEKDKHDWQGAQIPLIGFDELTHFSESQFFYMLSRNRSTCGVRPYVRATTNPDADSWVADFIAWWIDQEEGSPTHGLPIPARAGVIRWFVRINGEIVWGDSPAELEERAPCVPPKSATFIPASVQDNKKLLEADPGYLANLLALPLVEKERLLGGNWKVRAAAGKVFNRAWFDIVDAAPAGTRDVRYWDKAGTEDGGDWSVGTRIGYHAESGIFYVKDVVRGQWSSMHRNRTMRQVAELDGRAVEVWIEQEPGSGGKESAENSVKNLVGYTARAETVTGDKVTRAGPASAQAEAGNIKIVRGEWNEAYLAELHAFPEGKHDDQVDTTSGAVNKLALAPPKLPPLTSASYYTG